MISMVIRFDLGSLGQGEIGYLCFYHENIHFSDIYLAYIQETFGILYVMVMSGLTKDHYVNEAIAYGPCVACGHLVRKIDSSIYDILFLSCY